MSLLPAWHAATETFPGSDDLGLCSRVYLAFEDETEGMLRVLHALEVENTEPLDDLGVLAVLTGATHAIAVFEGTDPVTLLQQRIGWFVNHDGEQVNSITEVSVRRRV